MRRRSTAGVLAVALVACAAPAVNALEGRPGSGMLVIAHRGAPVYASEATMGGYERAANLGADLLEGDLVLSKDGRLVICHDIELSRITDVASKFPDRARVRTFNGVDYTGFWVDDFTWDELSTLRKPDGQGMTTFDDLLGFAQARGASLYMEIKESPYFLARGMDTVATLVSILNARGENQRGSRVWVQSGNPDDLIRVRGAVGNRTVYLTRSVGPEEVGLFPSFRQFADVLGVPTTRARRGLVAQAHAADLGVHVWTLRGSRDAYRKAAAIGADGVVTDFPDLGVNVRSRTRLTDRPSGLTTRVENGTAIASWTAEPGAWYAVNFDFGDPLEAPTLWVNGGSASFAMADAKSVDITVSKFVDNARLSGDAFSRASVTPFAYNQPRTSTRVRNVDAVVSTDGKTRISGVLERLKGKKWMPLRRGKGWLRGRGEDIENLRRNFTTDKDGSFLVTVRVREDIISGYVPERSWMAGVTATKSLKPSSSDWVDSREGAPPAPAKRPGKAQSLPAKDVRVQS